jgi:hypothetical protein
MYRTVWQPTANGNLVSKLTNLHLYSCTPQTIHYAHNTTGTDETKHQLSRRPANQIESEFWQATLHHAPLIYIFLNIFFDLYFFISNSPVPERLGNIKLVKS